MTENDKNLLLGFDRNDPNTIALIDTINARPEPAIEKPLGSRSEAAIEDIHKAEETEILQPEKSEEIVLAERWDLWRQRPRG